MKPTLRKSQSGSVLAMSLVACAFIGTALGSCLVLISNRNMSAMRATAWNAAIPVLEAGIEEALTHLHHDSNSPTANEWTADVVDGKPVYWKRSFPDFPDGSHYYVTNFGFGSSNPRIRSAGYVRSPLNDGQYISRVVEVGTTNPPSVFNYAIAANGFVKLSGNAIIDGYDSSLGNYDLITNRSAGGGVATNSKDSKAIDVGSGHIYGMAVTGPGGDVSVSGGSVGDLTWPSGKQPGWVNNDMNVQFQPNTPPAVSFVTVFPVLNGPTNTYYLGDGNYKFQSGVFSGNVLKPIIVTGNATLIVDELYITGSDLTAGYIKIEKDASLKLYVKKIANISGNGVMNESGLPANFALFGLPSCKTINYNGDGNFFGTINAPAAAVNISGVAQIFGAIICNTFTSSGTTSVHYDKASGYKGIFLVTSWREL